MVARGSVRIFLPFIIIGGLISIYNLMWASPILIFSMYLIWFFRDPNRTIIENSDEIKSAADGKVIYVEEFSEGIKIGVRMSPFDVHLNRSPISGRITKIQHKPGKHLSVYFGDVEKKNEQNLISIENEEFMCDILQITGIFARRLETWINAEDNVSQGQKIGIIRFGSQTNVFIKSKKANKQIILNVNIGEKVEAGVSVLAKIEDK